MYGSIETWVVGHNGPGCAWDADPAGVEARVGKVLLEQLSRIAHEVGDEPMAFVARVVDRLAVNPRTNKTPLLVKETLCRIAHHRVSQGP